MGSFLTPQEVAQLSGMHTPARQRHVLSSMGILYFVDDDGWPIVARSSVERTAEDKVRDGHR